jgi:DNA-binding NarL/FixJ family response regulator
MSEDSGLACEAISAGAAGYVLLDTAEVDLAEAVLAAARGDCYVFPRLAAGLSAQTRAEPRKLSKLHTAVLCLVAHANTDAQVMHELAISAGTLEMCRSELYRQLGIASRAELTRYALRHGLLGSG